VSISKAIAIRARTLDIMRAFDPNAEPPGITSRVCAPGLHEHRVTLHPDQFKAVIWSTLQARCSASAAVHFTRLACARTCVHPSPD
jgi:hypothetical protein